MLDSPLTLLRPFVRYDPPDGAQAVRPRDPRGAWEAITRFLTLCTDWVGPASANWTLSILEPGEHLPPTWEHQPVVARAQAILGPGSRYAGISRLDGASVTQKHEWRVCAHDLTVCLDLVAALPAWPARYVHPVNLRTAFFDLRLREPAGGLLPGQDDPGVQPLRSSVYVHLGSAPHASFDLLFPFAAPGVALWDYVTAIRPYLPVARVAWGRFRHYTPTKAGTAHVIRKVTLNR